MKPYLAAIALAFVLWAAVNYNDSQACATDNKVVVQMESAAAFSAEARMEGWKEFYETVDTKPAKTKYSTEWYRWREDLKSALDSDKSTPGQFDELHKRRSGLEGLAAKEVAGGKTTWFR